MRYLLLLPMTASLVFAQGPASEPPLNTGIPDWVGAWMFIPLAVVLLALLFAFISTSETRAPHDDENGEPNDSLSGQIPHTRSSQ